MSDTRPELELKKWELLHKTVNDEITQIEERFDKLEEKANRHLTILTVVLGVAAFAIEDVIGIFEGGCSVAQLAFLLSYLALVVISIATIVFHLLTFRFSELSQIEISNKFIKHVQDWKYITYLTEATKANVGHIAKNKDVLGRKIKYAETAYILTYFVIGFAVLSAILYFLYKVELSNLCLLQPDSPTATMMMETLLCLWKM